MEIKTCEEYVINELNNQKKYNEQLQEFISALSTIVNESETIEDARKKVFELYRSTLFIKC